MISIRNLRVDYELDLHRDQAVSISTRALELLAERLAAHPCWSGQIEEISLGPIQFSGGVTDSHAAAHRLAGAMFEGVARNFSGRKHA
jgi:hypothetical protein